MNNNDNLKPGDMVQVWDWQTDKHLNSVLHLHGKIGYIIKDQTKGSPPGLLWEIIVFDHYGSSYKQILNVDWLHKIKTADDIKKLVDI